MRRKLSPHQKIVRAAKQGRGLRLTPDEVWRLSTDDAIQSVAQHDDDEQSPPPPAPTFVWDGKLK